MSWWWPQARLVRLARIEGLEHLRQAQADGQGVILMALHFTTLEIGAALLGQEHTIDGMYREHKNPLFDYIQRRGRERHNPDATAIEREDVRAMLKVLRGGRAIWYAPDQDYGPKQSLFAPLFGIQAATVTATSKFARLGRARVLPFTQERLADGSGYRLSIHPPLADFPVTARRPTACASTSGSSRWSRLARSSTCGPTGASRPGHRARPSSTPEAARVALDCN